jgi:hypothetical protein
MIVYNNGGWVQLVGSYVSPVRYLSEKEIAEYYRDSEGYLVETLCVANIVTKYPRIECQKIASRPRK